MYHVYSRSTVLNQIVTCTGIDVITWRRKYPVVLMLVQHQVNNTIGIRTTYSCYVLSFDILVLLFSTNFKVTLVREFL